MERVVKSCLVEWRLAAFWRLLRSRHAGLPRTMLTLIG